MIDVAPEQRYANYPRPARDSVAKLKALADAYYSCPWWPWLCALILGSILFPIGLYVYCTVGVCAIASFVTTYRAYRKIAFAKDWSASSAWVAGVLAAVNVATYALQRIFLTASWIWVEFTVLGVVMIYVTNGIVKREVRRYGLKIVPFSDDFRSAVEKWSPPQEEPPRLP